MLRFVGFMENRGRGGRDGRGGWRSFIDMRCSGYFLGVGIDSYFLGQSILQLLFWASITFLGFEDKKRFEK